MKKIIMRGCLVLLGLGVLAVAGLLILAWKSKPLPGTVEALATLPASERAAYDAICTQAGIAPDSLRHVGGYDRYIFDHALNKRSVMIRDGHVIALCLREVTFSAGPEFGGLPALEALDLRGSGLAQWPDLSKLPVLKQANLSQQPLPTPEASHLPPDVVTLDLAGTRIADVTPLATMTRLRTLDLSGTLVATFEPLLGLKLDTLNLAGTPLKTLPANIPREGDWEIDLEGASLINPPGYSAKWPFDGWITSTSQNTDSATGVIGKEKVDVTGTASLVSKTRAIKMPRSIDPGVGPVVLEVTCTSGRARVWMEEPPGYFSSPWMQQGKVKGFGMLRGRGYVSQELSADRAATLRGSLRLSTESRIYEMPAERRSESGKPPDWCNYSFYMEPIGGAVEGVTFKVRNAR